MRAGYGGVHAAQVAVAWWGLFYAGDCLQPLCARLHVRADYVWYYDMCYPEERSCSSICWNCQGGGVFRHIVRCTIMVFSLVRWWKIMRMLRILFSSWSSLMWSCSSVPTGRVLCACWRVHGCRFVVRSSLFAAAWNTIFQHTLSQSYAVLCTNLWTLWPSWKTKTRGGRVKIRITSFNEPPSLLLIIPLGRASLLCCDGIVNPLSRPCSPRWRSAFCLWACKMLPPVRCSTGGSPQFVARSASAIRVVARRCVRREAWAGYGGHSAWRRNVVMPGDDDGVCRCRVKGSAWWRRLGWAEYFVSPLWWTQKKKIAIVPTMTTQNMRFCVHLLLSSCFDHIWANCNVYTLHRTQNQHMLSWFDNWWPN